MTEILHYLVEALAIVVFLCTIGALLIIGFLATKGDD